MSRRGQSVFEYATLACVIIIAILAMKIHINQAVAGRFKTDVDRIGGGFYLGGAGDNPVVSVVKRIPLESSGEGTRNIGGSKIFHNYTYGGVITTKE